MSDIYIGSARIDERGKTTGGKAGDQTGGEVSEQKFYAHKKGWYIIRPKKVMLANAIAQKMRDACANAHIGYNQADRLGVVRKGISTKTNTNCDCSSLVRECVKEATGYDPGNFTTANECTALAQTRLFEARKKYTTKTALYVGDILVTCTKGHTAIVTRGVTRSSKLSVDKVAKQVIAGKWGNGKERKARLSAAGYDYATVQKTVNKLIKQ